MSRYTHFKPADIDKLNVSQVTNLAYITSEKDDDIAIGSSTRDFPQMWFYLPDGRKGIFKTFGFNKEDQLRKARMANEIIVSKLLNRIGLKSATFIPATHSGMDGLLSINALEKGEFFDKNQFLWECTSFTRLAEKIDKYVHEGLIDDPDTKYKIYKLYILDLLTLQGDRGTGRHFGSNMDFMHSHGLLKFAPVVDNEYAFCIDFIEYLMSKNIKEINADELYQSYFENISHALLIINSKYLGRVETNKDRLDNLCHLATKDKNYKNALYDVLSKFNLEEVLNEMAAEGIKVSKEYAEFIKAMSSKVKEVFLDRFPDLRAELERE